MNNKNYTMPQLEKELKNAGFKDATSRKVRYFIEKGLLKGPRKKGGGARYDDDHFIRILAIQKLWKRFWRLSEIKQELDGMTAEQIRELALQTGPETTPMTREETDDKLRHGIPRSLSTPSPSIYQEPSLANNEEKSNFIESVASESYPAPNGNTWKRFNLLDGVELSVRNDSLRRLAKSAPIMAEEIQSILKQLSVQGVSYPTTPKAYGVSKSISEQFECYRLNGHLFAEIGEQRALLDTGCPQSFGNCGTLSICGRELPIPREWASPPAVYSAEEFGKLIETNFSVFVGADVLKEFDFLVDLKEGNISFATDLEIIGGEPIELQLKEGLPIVSVHLDGRPFPLLIATGNKLSFLHSSVARNYPVVGKDTDFLPRMWEFQGGKFETELRRVKVHLGGKSYALSFGEFPQVLEDFYRIVPGVGVMGTLGADLLEKGPVCFSLKRKMLFL